MIPETPYADGETTAVMSGSVFQECPGGLVAARVGKVSLREKAGQAGPSRSANMHPTAAPGPVAFLHERARMLQVTDPAMPGAGKVVHHGGDGSMKIR